MSLRFKKLHPAATVPTRATDGAAAYDLSACIDAPLRILPGERTLIATGLAVALPVTVAGRIAPRSGLGAKKGILPMEGVIDSDYRGEIKVCLFNHSNEAFTVQPGDRIAQLLLQVIWHPGAWEEVDDLDGTARGADGFGSTGLHSLTLAGALDAGQPADCFGQFEDFTFHHPCGVYLPLNNG